MLTDVTRGRLVRVLAWPAMLLLTACSNLSFGVANLPALFGAPRSTLQYMPGGRGRLDLFIPATPKRPLVVFFYGGGFDHGDRGQYRFVGSAIAGLGYVTVLPDYRLYPAVRFPDFLDDAARAVVFAHAHAQEWGADPQRIVLAGHSAGAYIAAMLALNPQYLERAGGDRRWLAGLVGLSGPYAIDPNSKVLHEIFDTPPWTPKDYRPLAFAGRGAPPTLLLHGTADDIVWPRQSQQLQAALRDAGVPVTLGLYEQRGHADTVAALALPVRFRAPTLADIEKFLATL